MGSTDNTLSWLEQGAPRYTSYPSAHHFHLLPALDYQGWLQQLDKDASVALYIHIPFCQQLCWFCGCHTKATARYEPVKAYIDTLLEEFRLLTLHLPHRPKVHSIHFGGGSPTLVNNEDLTRIFYAIDASCEILPDAEISIEIDPRRLTAEKAEIYALLGFNRASLGLQDFDPKVQEAINRIQPYNVVADAYALLQKNGIADISVDMIYGLPYQTMETIEKSIEKLLLLHPKRIAYFSYAHVPWMKKPQRLIPTPALPDIATKMHYYLKVQQLLEEQGYISIGIDHFAKAEDALCHSFRQRTLRRNFMGYSTLPNDTIIGLGASAISELPQGIAQNQPATHDYKKTIHSGAMPTIRGWVYNGEDRLRKAVISQLMCYLEVDVAAILAAYGYPEDHFDIALAALSVFEENKIISLGNRTIVFHSNLRMLIRLVAMQFDYYATTDTKNYSKIV